MAVQKILDRTGDTRFEFDPMDAAGISAAEERFTALTGAGFLAFEPGNGTQPGRKINHFDPSVETTIFTPQRVGG